MYGYYVIENQSINYFCSLRISTLLCLFGWFIVVLYNSPSKFSMLEALMEQLYLSSDKTAYRLTLFNNWETFEGI